MAKLKLSNELERWAFTEWNKVYMQNFLWNAVQNLDT